ncbi:hypothetical protein [Nocardia flavorosea]|uniref:Uncharacterized protein n=1 Tax=Nocardia flavorosea TaxID=53429 RepID=A0A846YRW0_9NOCA|nr:hypothetical protein [Nocardia flavorosea]NKY60411.1 hypothetical protein [Nocardia flavorosea]
MTARVVDLESVRAAVLDLARDLRFEGQGRYAEIAVQIARQIPREDTE